jgi:hypothetical protein
MAVTSRTRDGAVVTVAFKHPPLHV